MKKISAPLVIFLLLANLVSAQTPQTCSYIKVLASDSMGGRLTGTKYADMAATYIKQQFAADKLELLFDAGLQVFDVSTGVGLGANNHFMYNDEKFIAETDYTPYSYSQDTTIITTLVFAGYGFAINNDSVLWDDYKTLDIKNKWVLVLRGNPIDNKTNNKFTNFSSDRIKMMVAKDRGAAGIILVTPTAMNKSDELVNLNLEKSKSRSGICVLNITRKTADKILSISKKTIAALEKKAKTAAAASCDLKGALDVAVQIVPVKAKTANVAGLLKSTTKTDNYIVIGAHYDHLGMGGHGSGSRLPDTVAVHYGADDNASGTACVMAMAHRFSKPNFTGNYNLIFVAFTGEEEGLLGSNYFVKHLPVDAKKIKLMINYDMVGRLNDKKILSVGGTGTFADAEKLLKQNNDTTKLKLSFSKEGYGPSDHASFYSDSIPVLYFNTGVHADYHTPADNYKKINCTGLEQVADYTAMVIEDLEKNTYNLAYMEAGPKSRTSQRSGMKVILGIMPDFNNQDVKGVGVAAVNADGPAIRGGIQKGDVIIAINGKSVNDIYEYMERLKALNPGQTITVDVMRNNKKEVLLIQL
ncbi:MAG: M28 family peptidase [Bacteroidota bacterium]